MKKIIIILFMLLTVSKPSYAINLLEKIAYKRDVIKTCNAKVLVNPITGEVKYLWCTTVPARTNGHWEPISGTSKLQFQAMYDQQNKVEKSQQKAE